jgi:hypothetical protein
MPVKITSTAKQQTAHFRLSFMSRMRYTPHSLCWILDVNTSQYDIMQLIKIKQELPVINLILLGGAGAPLVRSSAPFLSSSNPFRR